jgi:hypothetical protein
MYDERNLGNDATRFSVSYPAEGIASGMTIEVEHQQL